MILARLPGCGSTWSDSLIISVCFSNSIIFFCCYMIPSIMFTWIIQNWGNWSKFIKVGIFVYANFILACGTTHLFKILEIWIPIYSIAAKVDWWCAISSIAAFLYIFTETFNEKIK